MNAASRRGATCLRHAGGALLALAIAMPLGHAAQPVDATPPVLMHAMFQDHAVLQRDQPIRIRGRTRPGAEVGVAIAGNRARAHADGTGRWEAVLPALPAGGPHVLTATSAGVEQTIDDVLVGDVWLCSGQSNMELQVWRSLDARAEIAGASNDRIRLLTVPQAGSPLPLEEFASPVRWQAVTSDSVRDFSAACYFFARELQQTIDVPMGLVAAAWGGSRIEAWTSGEALRALGLYDAELDVLQRHVSDEPAAAGDWGALWQGWWSGRPGIVAGDRPWEGGEPAGRWHDAPEQLGAWERWGVPELAAFDGMVWYRTRVRLDAAQAMQDAVLLLGPADEVDMTWVNGRGVGSTYGAGDRREYALPSGVLREGVNTIVVNVLDTYRDGGLAGPASAHAIRLADGSQVPLEASWRYRVVPPEVGSPPRAPWQTAAGLSTLYNGMIAPIGRYGLRGIVWYQGESNTFEADRYRDLLRTWRNDWRARFGAGLPLLVVQLAGFGKPPTRPGDSAWAALREAQRLGVGEDAHSALAVAIDIGDRYDVHPPNKQELGRRLARAARAVVFGETTLPPSGPTPAAVRREGDAVSVTFADATDGLVAYGADGPVGFELCGAAAGSCRYASAQIRGDEVVLRAALDTPAARVRYGWADSPVVTLFDGAGLPAGPFELAVPPPSDR